jgi:hypothetical protein
LDFWRFRAAGALGYVEDYSIGAPIVFYLVEKSVFIVSEGC